MSKRKQIGDVTINYPEAYTMRQSAGAPSSTGKKRGARKSSSPSDDFVLKVLEEAHDFKVERTFELDRSQQRKRRGAAASDEDSLVTVSVPAKADQQMVMLVEEDGVYRWVFAKEAKKTRTRRSGRPGQRKSRPVDLQFEIDLGGDVYLPANRRGLKGKAKSLAGKVKAHVVKIGNALSPSNLAMKFLERNVDNCLLDLKVKNGATDATKWKQLETYEALALPSNEPARVLLFVHGTFSSTIGSYGGLSAIPEGQSFLEIAAAQYDVILGYDHPTLSVDPGDNALKLLEFLKKALGASRHPPEIDAIGYSRGGLVLRSLIEQVLPTDPWKARVNRAIFIGATNAGTQLAEPENWYRFIDFYTNLAVASSRVVSVVSGNPLGSPIFAGMIRGLGAMAKFLATSSVTKAKIPGLAAMEPDGSFVKSINKTQPGQPGAGEIAYFAITSDFDVEGARNGETPGLPKRLLFSLGDSLVDQLIGDKANDLVVDTASMTSIDPHVEGLIEEVSDFGRNGQVYHTVYFVQPATAHALHAWLELPGVLKSSDKAVAERKKRTVRIAGDEYTHFESMPATFHHASIKESSPVKSQPVKVRPKLKVSVFWDDITESEGDVYAVGHYIGVMPQHAEKAVDHHVSQIPWRSGDEGLVLTQLTRQGLLRGELGQIDLFPWGDESQRLAAICGMGFFDGDFSEQNVRLLYRNLARQIIALPDASKLCTVLIGSGVGALEPPQALRGQLNGYADALAAPSIEREQFDEVKIVEIDKAKAEIILDCLHEFHLQDNLDLELILDEEVQTLGTGYVSTEHALSLLVGSMLKTYGSKSAPKRRELLEAYLSKSGIRSVKKGEIERQLEYAWKKLSDGLSKDDLTEKTLSQTITVALSTADRGDDSEPTRVSIRLQNNIYRLAALTSSSAIPEREIGVDVEILNELVERMTDPERKEVSRYGKMLHRLLIPRDFEKLFTANNKIVFEVDRNTATLNWEMLVDPLREELGSVGLHSQTSRQLRTTYSNMPSARSENTRRALVVGNPDGTLPYAQQEALTVSDLLRGEKFEVDTFIGPSDADGKGVSNHPPATRIDVLEKLFDGKYDIVHYSGHGDYDELDPTKTGWIFENGLLTAKELERLGDAPSLIFANACLSGKTSAATRGTMGDREGRSLNLSKPYGEAGLLPSLADEVIKLGVRNYVGTAWEVYDEGAILFARKFYSYLLTQNTIGEAMYEARKVLARHEQYGAMWAAYQHYGSPDFVLARQ